MISTANQAAHDFLPAGHRQYFEEKLASLDPVKTQHIIFGKVTPLELDVDTLFSESLALFLLGIERDRVIEGMANPAKPAKARLKRAAN